MIVRSAPVARSVPSSVVVDSPRTTLVIELWKLNMMCEAALRVSVVASGLPIPLNEILLSASLWLNVTSWSPSSTTLITTEQFPLEGMKLKP